MYNIKCASSLQCTISHNTQSQYTISIHYHNTQSQYTIQYNNTKQYNKIQYNKIKYNKIQKKRIQ